VDELTSPSGGPALVRWLSRVLLGVSALVFGSWAVLALAHVDDDYHVSWVAGSWIALARAVNHGVLYPPLYDGESFGGTRYMPLQFVLHAGVARTTGEYLVSGKLLAYGAAASLYVLAFVVYMRLSGSAVLATGLVAAVLCSGTGLEAATTVRGDALPAALQLAAVALVVVRRSRAATVTAALLCSFAFFGKLSAIWGAAAIVAWLALRDRPRLGLFALSLFASAGALFAIFEAASSGRMSSNIWSLAGAGQPHDFSPFVFADKVVRAAQELGATWVLLPFAVTSVGIAVAGRRTTIYCLAALTAAAVAVVVLIDTGAYRNHLLDVQILVGALVAELWRTAGAASLIRAAVLAGVVVGTLGSYQTDMLNDTKDGLRVLAGEQLGFTARPLKGTLSPGDRVLSEDPYVPISRGDRPVVLDAFILRKILADNPDWERALVRDIKDQRFTKIVLVRQLDPSDTWWRDFDFGVPVARAISGSYRLLEVPDDVVGGSPRLWVYVRRGRSS
jgi:hypothetical protein